MPTDMFDRPVNVGDYIVAAMLWGRSAELRFGKIVSFTPQKGYSAKPGEVWISVLWASDGRYSTKKSRIDSTLKKFMLTEKPAFIEDRGDELINHSKEINVVDRQI